MVSVVPVLVGSSVNLSSNHLVATQTIATNWLRQAVPAAEIVGVTDYSMATEPKDGHEARHRVVVLRRRCRDLIARPASSTTNVIKRSQVRLGRWMPARCGLVPQT
jgi:hypothetical protein